MLFRPLINALFDTTGTVSNKAFINGLNSILIPPLIWYNEIKYIIYIYKKIIKILVIIVVGTIIGGYSSHLIFYL